MWAFYPFGDKDVGVGINIKKALQLLVFGTNE